MRSALLGFSLLGLRLGASAVASAGVPTLAEVCTTAYIAKHLPAADFHTGLTINNSSITAKAVNQASTPGSDFFPAATYSYCDVTLKYTHDGLGDEVVLTFWLPAPADFKNRYLATGGGGYAINSGTQSLPGGVQYGAVATYTDGGFGASAQNTISTFLLADGTENWEKIYAFGYKAIYEQIVVGKAFTRSFYNLDATNTTLYSYYQGCSEGGREGWSQVQRFTELDGAIIGAPAFRFAFQQVQHLYSGVVENTLNYFPPPCELTKIMEATITACDPLDGRTDGVVSRNDLCSLHFDLNSTVGLAYDCPGRGLTPAQKGTVSKEAVAVAQEVLNGLHTTDGKRVYFSYTMSSTYTDAQTTYNRNSDSWVATPSGLGGSFVEVLLELTKGNNIPSLDGVTYDTLRDWIWEGWNKYNDVLMTNWPDLTQYRDSGAKILTFHGESDFSIPTASSVRFYESVRSVLYPGVSYNESVAEMDSWYRLFLVPGAGHCGTNSYEPNGPFPQTNMAVMIDWVEKGVEPKTLNATVLQGTDKGENQDICSWPLRPLWTKSGTVMECVYDQASIDTWIYDIDAFPMPVY
ncbi:Tannase/feruloyl esterase [Xylariales sp. PMI_506]|nr:Tannase/feruloyl esterase [Xylariales sp. PMI_506]